MSRKLYITGLDKDRLLKIIHGDIDLKEKNKPYIIDLELELEKNPRRCDHHEHTSAASL